MENNKAVLLYNKVSENPTIDERDVLDQMESIGEALTELGYHIVEVPFSINIMDAINQLREINPAFVFNLVESFDGSNELQSIGAMILHHLKIPYTGASHESLFLSTNKLLAKRIMHEAGINTPEWFMMQDINKLNPEYKYIIKPIAEDGSVNLDEHSVFDGNDQEYINAIRNHNPSEYFIEQYIDGREFNISVMGTKFNPKVMPAAEIIFEGYPDDKPKVVGYKAKWIEDSYEYDHTPRHFEFQESDTPLLDELRKITVECWNVFELKGYARVDIRVDKNNVPYIIEINGNPCINVYSGFSVAVNQSGLSYKEMISTIVNEALHRN